MTGSSQWWRQSIPWGDIVVVAGPGGIRTISLQRVATDEFETEPRPDRAIAEQFDEYFAGRREAFDVTVDLAAASLTEFSHRVLETLRDDVGYGETVTYGELAEMAARPGAARAVGSTMARNPVPFVIPCHRVVGANGLGGYGGGYGGRQEDGLALKRALLNLESGGRSTY